MVGDRIRKLRKDRGWTQKELAEKTGVDSKNISSYESGRLVPSSRTLRKFAQAFELTLEELTSAQPQQPALALGDPEMLRLFKEVLTLSESEQNHIKWMLNMAVRQNRIQEMMMSASLAS